MVEKTNRPTRLTYKFPMFLSLVVIAAMITGEANVPAVPTVRNVTVEGNARVSTAVILSRVSAKPNSSYDPKAFRQDLRKLYSLGVFEDLQLQSSDTENGQVDLIYKVREYPYISGFSIEGVDSKLEEQLHAHLKKEKLELQPATPFRPAAGNRAVLAVRDFLRSRKYANAEVRMTTEKSGKTVRVVINVLQGKKLEIGSVRFVGNKSIGSPELMKEMRFARPAHFWARWGGAARYVPEELTDDLQRIQTCYKSHGFAAAKIGTPKIQATGIDSKQHIEIEIPIFEGERYRLTSVKMEGAVKSGSAGLEQLIASIPIPSEYDYSLLDRTRQKMVDSLGHQGYALARIDLEQLPNEAERTIQATYRVRAGDAVLIGRIQFDGNSRLPDKFLRRELRAREGEVFDTAKLDKSVERLNKSNLLQELRRADVALKLNEQTNLLDITFKVKEKDRQGIYGTGGTGGINGGYLGILYTAFNFLHLGETLSLQLDGGAAQSNMLLNIVGTHFLGSPFTVALSVFNRYAGFNVANVVPGPESLVKVLRSRSRGVGLSGAYPVTANLQLGTAFQAERDSISGLAADNSTTRTLRSEVAPFVVYDRTRGTGSDTRGYRFSYAQGWYGSLFLKSLDSTSRSVQLTRYIDDPFTKGRNSFAFYLQGSWVRPHGLGSLLMERRLYPGNESVRGFSRGSLSPWASVPGVEGLQPSGADTVLGFSTEYRVPIQGPLSGAGFLDLGWTHLNPREAARLGTAARLIEATNGVLRASVGGELRLQLPVIRQPARLIFSWNPLRLDTFFSSPSSIIHLAEPKKSLRFALGTLY